MNTKLILLLISIAAFSSCTTLYKAGQTPDDVYYSPTRPAGYAQERQEQRSEVSDVYASEDRVIRMGINDYRWRSLDNGFTYNSYINDFSYSPYSYGYNPYSYGYNYGYYYNPYYYPYPVYNNVVYVKPSSYNPRITTPRVANLSGYTPVRGTNLNTNHGTGRPMRSYNNTNNGSAVGNAIRQIFTPTNSNSSVNNSNSSNNTRSYTPSTNNSSSSAGSRSSSSGSSGGGVSRPPRN